MAGKFKEFGKKLGDAAKNTAKKSEELIEIQKVKGKIRDKENAIDESIKKIGEATLAKFEEGEEVFPEAADLCRDIQAARNEIKELEEDILELRHIRICPSCGAENEDEVAFCPKCGHKYEPKPEPEAEEEPEGKKCASCGEPLEEGVAFCPHCGEKVG